MKFQIKGYYNKLKVSCFSKNKTYPKYVYDEFEKQHVLYKHSRKVDFRQKKINGKYGECYLVEFEVLTDKLK